MGVVVGRLVVVVGGSRPGGMLRRFERVVLKVEVLKVVVVGVKLDVMVGKLPSEN